MENLEIQPIPNEPALLIERKNILVIADLHIGIETELREHGLNTPSQTHVMTDHLVSLCRKHRAKEIILLGDVKHNIPSSTIQERRDVRKFLEELQTYCVVHILPGNHDGNIKKILPDDVLIHPSDGFVFEDIGFIHGHRWPSDEIMHCEQIIIGHTHPTVMLTDRLGYKTFESCWLKARTVKDKLRVKYPNAENSDILVMPAFIPLCGGIAVNGEGVNGPIGKIIDIRNAEVYLLDGASLGRVRDIL